MNSDIFYGAFAIALAVIALWLSPQLWELSGNEATCGSVVPENATDSQCKQAYEFYSLNELILLIAGVIFAMLGIALIINGFRE